MSRFVNQSAFGGLKPIGKVRKLEKCVPLRFERSTESFKIREMFFAFAESKRSYFGSEV